MTPWRNLAHRSRLWLVFPYTTKVGAALLVATMAGAIVAHFTVLGDPVTSIFPAVLAVAAAAVALREPSYDIAELSRSARSG